MRKKILMAVSILFGLMMLNSGLNKFFNYMPMPKDMPESMVQVFNAFMQIGWLFPLIAAAEIIGGILFMIPRYRAIGAIVITPILVGVLVFHAVQAPQGILIAVILMGINIWAIAEDWDKFRPLVK